MLTSIINKVENLTNEEREFLNDLNNRITPKQVDNTGYDDMDFYICPNCKKELVAIDSIDYYETDNYCGHCGQALNWNNL